MLNFYFHQGHAKIEKFEILKFFEIEMCKVNLLIHSNISILFKLNFKNLPNYNSLKMVAYSGFNVKHI